MYQMNAKQMDQKYGPVYRLMLAARTAHGEFLKGRNTPEAQTLRTKADAAKTAVTQATSKFTFGGITQLVDYVTDVIFFTCLSADKRTFDYKKGLWLSKVLISTPDERQLPGGKKNRQEKLGALRARSNGNFIRACERTDLVPKFGPDAKGVQYVLGRLQTKIDEVQKAESIMQVRELTDLYNEVKASFPKHWFEERQPYTPPPQPTLAETLPEGSREVMQSAVTPATPPAAEVPATETPSAKVAPRGSRRQGRRG